MTARIIRLGSYHREPADLDLPSIIANEIEANERRDEARGIYATLDHPDPRVGLAWLNRQLARIAAVTVGSVEHEISHMEKQHAA